MDESESHWFAMCCETGKGSSLFSVEQEAALDELFAIPNGLDLSLQRSACGGTPRATGSTLHPAAHSPQVDSDATRLL